jgi:hypothetical protein
MFVLEQKKMRVIFVVEGVVGADGDAEGWDELEWEYGVCAEGVALWKKTCGDYLE